jgi:thiamine-phosphate pyrophosphorylase
MPARSSPEGCRLYLVVPVDTSDAGDKLASALAAADVACVLLTAPEQGYPESALVRPLVKLAQEKGVAALIEDDLALARSVRADGVHLSPLGPAYAEARAALGAKAAVGGAAAGSRHEAMELGEAGADYVAFDGEPDEVDELVGWWAELFTVPCVAWDVMTLEEAEALADLGVDFVALAPEAWMEATDPGAVLAAFAEAIERW